VLCEYKEDDELEVAYMTRSTHTIAWEDPKACPVSSKRFEAAKATAPNSVPVSTSGILDSSFSVATSGS
jgi:hypothetical protein